MPEAAAAAPTAVEGAASAQSAMSDVNADEAVPQLLPPQPDDGLRPLGSKPLRSRGGGGTPPRFDPQLLPEVVKVFHRASQRLRFTTQLPQAVAPYVAAASQRGTLDLSAFGVSMCTELLLYLGHAQVVHRDCLEELRRSLQPRWSQLQPDELVAALVALGRLNDADRVSAHSNRPGPGASRLLRLLCDAEPCVMPLLEAPLQRLQAGAAALEAPLLPPPPGCSPPASSPGLQPDGATQLALVYLSFYRSATSGHQHFSSVTMLQHNLEMCLAALADPGDPRQAPAEELGRLVAGLAGVTLLRSNGLTPHLPRLVAAVMKRAAELPQSARGLLLDLPPQHFALPPNWRKTLLSNASAGNSKKAVNSAARRA